MNFKVDIQQLKLFPNQKYLYCVSDHDLDPLIFLIGPNLCEWLGLCCTIYFFWETNTHTQGRGKTILIKRDNSTQKYFLKEGVPSYTTQNIQSIVQNVDSIVNCIILKLRVLLEVTNYLIKEKKNLNCDLFTYLLIKVC